MDMRITPQALLNRQLTYMRRQTDALSGSQEDIATGLKLRRPSDNPLDMMSVLSSKSEDGRAATFQKNVQSAQDRLNRGNSALTETNKLLTRARQIAVEGGNATLDQAGRNALAIEVDRILDQTIEGANTQVDGRYLFGGTDNRQAPFVVTARDNANRPTAVDYQGSGNRSSLAVGRNQQIDLLYTGDRVFKSPGKDVFTELMGLRDELRNTGGVMSEGAQAQALSARVGTLTTAQNSMLDTVGEVSSSLASLETLSARLGDQRLEIQTRISGLESADIAESVVTLKTQETLFQSTLAMAARVFDQSLLDFVR